MDPERQGGQGVSAYLTICKDVQGHASLRCTMKVDAVFEHCWSPADGRKALDGPDLIFTFAYLKPSLKAEWEHLRIYCSILDKRSHFAIENFLFTGPASDRMKYGPTFLDAICIFLGELYDCPDYSPPTQIRWDLQSEESAECHFEQAAAVGVRSPTTLRCCDSFRTPLQMLAMDRILNICSRKRTKSNYHQLLNVCLFTGVFSSLLV